MNIQAAKERAMQIDKSKSLLSPLVDNSEVHRCAVCNTVIMKGSFSHGVVEIRCRKCGHFTPLASA
jgi:hypothetical protein